MATWRIVGSELEEITEPLLVGVHDPGECADGVCTVHHPTDHPMRDWPLHWRGDRGLFERLCTHGVGHPDPDQWAFWDSALDVADAQAMRVHGCDGCCRCR